MQSLIDNDIGDATSRKLKAVLDSSDHKASMELELALCMDLEPIDKAIYDLEGDGLCVLHAHRRVEALRAMGPALSDQVTLPNTAAYLRKTTPLAAGKYEA